MKLLSCILAFSLAVAAHAAETLHIVASVTRIHEEGAPMQPGVYIDFVVHSPAELQGLPVTMFTTGASRRARRAEFPLGAQFRIALPEAAVAALKKAKKDDEHVQGMIDDGVKPEMISQLVLPAQIVLAELTTKPARVEVR